MVLVTVSLSPRREDRAPGTPTPVSEHIQPAKTLDRIGLSHSLPRSCQHPPHGGCGTTRFFHHPGEAPPRRGLLAPVAQLHRNRRHQHTPHNTTHPPNPPPPHKKKKERKTKTPPPEKIFFYIKKNIFFGGGGGEVVPLLFR